MKTLHSIENVPLELKDIPQWVLWNYEVRDGKETKIPYVAGDAKRASSTDPSTWRPFRLAVINNGRDGIGYVFSEDDGNAGVDIDNCIVNDTIEPWAQEIVTNLNSYSEVSPSGNGVKIFLRGAKPGKKCKSGKNHYRPGQIEMYDSGRYFTLTGRHIEGTPLTIEDRQTELNALYWRVFGQDSPQPTQEENQPADSDNKFARLWAGDISDYPSRSEADLALCHFLAKSTRNPAQIDVLFRQSGLMREKWERKDYRERTIKKALEGQLQQRHNLTDTGNAKRLVAQYGAELRYCFPWRKWLVWNDTHWGEDRTGQLMRRAKATVQTIYGEAATIVDDDKRKKVVGHAIRSEGAKYLRAAIDLSKDEVPVLPEMLDRDPWLLNVQNGTLDLQTGELMAHDPKRLMTKIAPVRYDRDAPCSLWLSFLDRIMDGNYSLIEFLQRAIGYSLTGNTREQCLFVAWGGGDNGKTTLQQALTALLGDYGQTTPIGTLTARRQGNAASGDLARLRGARYVTASEADEGVCFAESTVKLLTGGDTIAARFLYSDVFEFLPQFKLWISTNHKPVIKGTDHAIWRRIRLIPFTVAIPEAEQDKDLVTKLQAELPGILSWAVQGCLDWQEKGLDVPTEVKDATKEYRAEMDTVGLFLAENCAEDDDAKVGKGKLYVAFDQWGGDKTKREFSKAMQEKGFSSGRLPTGVRIWEGIGFGKSESKG